MLLRDYKHLQQDNQRTYLKGIVHSHRKTGKSYFLQLRMFDVCTTGDTTHIDTLFKFLSHTRVNMDASIFFTAAMIRAFRSARSRGNDWDEYCARNARCTVTTDLLCDIPTHKTTSPPRSGHFLTIYTRIA